jgi:hypothetical protein
LWSVNTEPEYQEEEVEVQSAKARARRGSPKPLFNSNEG